MIPLRPLGVGEILDGAFASIRRNPKTILGLAAIIVTVLLTLIVQAVLAGLLAPVIAREVSGQRISAGDAWRAAAPRLPSVLLATLLVVLAGLGPLLVLGRHPADRVRGRRFPPGRVRRHRGTRVLRGGRAQHLALDHVQPGRSPLSCSSARGR